MRKILILIGCILVVLLATVPTASASTKIEPEFMNRIISTVMQESNPYAKFSIAYIDDDYIPDVLVSSGDSHASAVTIFLLKNNSITKVTTPDGLDAFGSYGSRVEYIPGANRIKSTDSGQGSYTEIFYNIVDGVAIKDCELTKVEREYYSFYKNGVSITENQYIAFKKEHYNDGKNYVAVPEYSNSIPGLNEQNLRCVYESFVLDQFRYVSNDKNKMKVYAEDGRCEIINPNDLELWEKVGWYDFPITTVYTSNEVSFKARKEQMPYWLRWGYFANDNVTMYALDGRTELVPKDKVQSWIDVGWYTEAPVKMYAADGRTIVIPGNQIEAYKKVGWYEKPRIVLYSNSGVVTISAEQKDSYKKRGWRELHEFFLGKTYNWFSSYYGKLSPEFSWEGGDYYKLNNSSVAVGFGSANFSKKSKCTAVVAESLNVLFPDLAVLAKNNILHVDTISDYFNQYRYTYDYYYEFDCYRIIYEVYSKYTKSTYHVVFYAEDGTSGNVAIDTDVDVFLK